MMLENSNVKGSTAGIQPEHAARINDRLALLNAAQTIEDMDKPGYRLHPLKGNKEGALGGQCFCKLAYHF